MSFGVASTSWTLDLLKAVHKPRSHGARLVGRASSNGRERTRVRRAFARELGGKPANLAPLGYSRVHCREIGRGVVGPVPCVGDLRAHAATEFGAQGRSSPCGASVRTSLELVFSTCGNPNGGLR